MLKSTAVCAAIIFSASTAFGHSLTVPFFKDDAPSYGNGSVPEGSAGFISIVNTTGNTVTMNVVYTQQDLNGDFVVQEAVEFPLSARQSVSWRPVADEAIEGVGRGVPNVLAGFGAEGSVQLIWLASEGGPSALAGRYSEYSNSSAFAHVLDRD